MHKPAREQGRNYQVGFIAPASRAGFCNVLMKIATGESVILVLHTPREKLLGILDEINQSGVYVRAIDLGYFDDWVTSITNDEQYLPMSDYFIPMWRVERISRDEGSPTMTEIFEQRTGKNLGEF